MRRIAIAALLALPLTGCDKPAPDPVEQIVVRKPGAVPAATVAAQSGADAVAAGRQAFAATCAGCHAVTANARPGAGPTLYGVIGRKAGTLPGYAYSKVMTASGIIWNPREIDQFLTNPAARVPGTAMTAGAVASPATRHSIAEYLQTLGAKE
ncbi:MAG: hypothetical protein RLZZ84_1552 [Pseudomonadota bacterium]|jgi:cytochrome c2